jgi:hypothetical protein
VALKSRTDFTVGMLKMKPTTGIFRKNGIAVGRKSLPGDGAV